MKKLLTITALSVVIIGTSAYAADCTQSVNTSQCVNISCSDILGSIYGGENCSDILNSICGSSDCNEILESMGGNTGCGNISEDITEKLKEALQNQFNIPVELETNTYTEPITEQITYNFEIPTQEQKPAETTQAQKPDITTEAATEFTTKTQKPALTTQTTTEAATEATTSVTDSSYAQQVLDLVNNERTKYGLSALTLNTSLNNVAQIKAEDMEANNYFSHTSPTYGTPFEMMKTYGISYSAAGENIAKGQSSPQEVVEDWLNSEGHRKNILNSSFTQMGLGFSGSDSKCWVQMFIG